MYKISIYIYTNKFEIWNENGTNFELEIIELDHWWYVAGYNNGSVNYDTIGSRSVLAL